LFDRAGIHTVLAEKELYDGSSGISHRAIVGDLAVLQCLDKLPLDIPSLAFSQQYRSVPPGQPWRGKELMGI
jgi:hypothetical protein